MLLVTVDQLLNGFDILMTCAVVDLVDAIPFAMGCLTST